ncbi:helix-turn-helix domain-containing protein [Budvicia diplopodorum]|uniref:helix-turn-helix domain-containing protein n=1 Tax=Budvicia diplopodorum TaxID=1119056 RepID=UPI00135CD7CB|nr:helix-turn-helix transcriptional regulator [Budvicia diplopodorum]
MDLLSLLSANDVQKRLADYLQSRRKTAKLSRGDLAKRSTVPESTIKKFETTGQISLRQFLLLWQSLDSLDSLYDLTKPKLSRPTSIEEVINS